MNKFGKIKQLKLRDVWENEAFDFTPWLSENISELGESLGIELEIESREADVGDFSLDILAKDLGSGGFVVIENQLTLTDHDHLGKLLTYAAGFGAKTVVWIAERIREEHRQALDWLNQRTDSDTQFFGVVVEIIKIDDSRPAINFKPIVFPNEWQKTKRREASGKVTPRAENYKQFFQNLIDDLREKHKFTNAKVGQPQSWYSFSSGITGITYGAVFAKGGRVRVELYIGQRDQIKNKALFDIIREQKDNIEEEIGNSLEWERLDNSQSSRIGIYRDGKIDNDDKELQEIHDWMIRYLLILKKVFEKRLKIAFGKIKNTSDY